MIGKAMLDENSLAVFYTRVSSLLPDQIGSLVRVLGPEETNRAARFVFAKDRELYIAAHALLRFGFSSAGCAPQCQLRSDSYGKPELETPFGDPPLRFNLSHTNRLAACVLSYGHAVGIDVEEINRSLDFEAITRKAFAPEEQLLLDATTPGDRPVTFFRLWTLKEAIIKGIGRGLMIPTAHFAFKLDPLSVNIAPNAGEDSATWHLQELAPTANHRLAIAAKRSSQTILSVTSADISITTLIKWSRDLAVGVKQADHAAKLR